jgi:hypothetical protein
VIVPVLEVVDRALATQLAHAHHELDAAAGAVRRHARALTLARAGERGTPCRQLHQAVNDYTVRCLAHLHHEETVVNATLWGALGDRDLLERQRQIVALVGAERCSEWRAILEPAVSEAERASLIESCSATRPG